MKARTLTDFRAHAFPQPELLLGKWLPSGGICMIYGPRGAGKTFLTLTLALAVAGGTSIIGFKAPKPRKVLYVDAEMNPAKVQERFDKLFEGMSFGIHVDWHLFYLSHAEFDRGIPDLSELDRVTRRNKGRDMLLEEIRATGAELVILDNLSSLVRSGDENSAESWNSFNSWLLDLRRLNVTTLVIHHAGKRSVEGFVKQRGTSRREDIMDTVVQLDVGEITKDPDRVTMWWTYEKCRSFVPDPPFEIAMEFGEGDASVTIEKAGDPRMEIVWEQAMRMQAAGCSIREIAEETGIPKSTLADRLKKLKRSVAGSL